MQTFRGFSVLYWLQTPLYCEGINHEAGSDSFLQCRLLHHPFHCTVTKRFHATCHQPLYETGIRNNRFLTTSSPFQSHLPSLQERLRFIFSSLENITSSSPPVLNNMHMFRKCYGNEAQNGRWSSAAHISLGKTNQWPSLRGPLVCIERGPNIMNQ